MRALRQAELAHTFRVRHAGMFATGKNLRTSAVFFFFFLTIQFAIPGSSLTDFLLAGICVGWKMGDNQLHQ